MSKRASKSKKSKKLFAFWHYDQFPYLLGATGTLGDDGWFQPDSYGGHQFWPDKVFHNVEEGKAVHVKLKALTFERRQVMDALESGFKARLVTMVAWNKEPWMRKPVGKDGKG